MWYEVMPAAIIIGTCLAMPQIAAIYWNKAVFGNSYRRNLNEFWDRHMFTRDTRIGGAPWIIKGIENIPDGE
ncbi:NADH dehydrogenase [ubiquinone] 1 alpha subcomplex subunit 1 [Fopius arisanus]|uniref:NADH dehydrogenase [ubiquinone] 1 alpha subcomplex subunit 1 n=1 Tax=Fopius arisanus TaxID=64838 RepID=A0A9R1SVQ6_9HYME|nr:PREDICTED: NADH dehydrogenase [ubiquinone] 1 alpha subcomplex subunit 1 [Fopius arisanus]